MRPANLRALKLHAGAFRNGRLIGNPAARAQIAAAAALVGWHGAGNGWWQHPGGFYGWVGPLFWPFAYNDLYDYTIWGDGLGFWGYGYPDIYAGIFGPYGYDGLATYLPQRPSGRRRARSIPLDQLCGSDRREITGLPIDQIAAAVQPTDAQGANLDDLGNASIQAAAIIRVSCPTQVAATAPGRLAAMQQRVDAMVKAVELVQPALDKFYGSLTDEQRPVSMRWPRTSAAQSLPATPMRRWCRIAVRLSGSIGQARRSTRGSIPVRPSVPLCKCFRIPVPGSMMRSRRRASRAT